MLDSDFTFMIYFCHSSDTMLIVQFITYKEKAAEGSRLLSQSGTDSEEIEAASYRVSKAKTDFITMTAESAVTV